MTDIVVDTDVVSYGYRGSPEFAFYEQHLVGNRAIVSFMTYAELLYGAASRGWGERRWEELRRYVLQRHVVYDSPMSLCAIWASLLCQSRSKGRVLHHADAWVAATAIYLNVPLLTNNRRDFDYLEGLQVISNAPA